MDNSNACGLKIKQIIAILIILIILALTVQLFKLNQVRTIEIAEEVRIISSFASSLESNNPNN